MIRTLLATTAVATLLTTGAIAQETTAPAAGGATTTTTTAAPADGQMQNDQLMQMNGFLASNLIGENVYNGIIQDAGAMQGGQAGQAGQVVDPAAGTAAGGTVAADGTVTQDPAAGGTMAADGTMTQDGQAAGANVQMSQDGQAIQTVENIGDVNDLVIDQNGQVQAIVVGVGGFLGIGQRDVALSFNEIQWAMGQDGNPYIVVNATRDTLEAMPEFDRRQFAQPTADNTAMNTTDTTTGGMAPAAGVGAAAGAGAAAVTQGVNDAATATADTAENAADATANTVDNAANTVTTTTTATDTTQTGAIDRTQLQEIPQDQLTAETLVGTTVYGANDENIGEIGDIVLTQDGQVDAVLVDVGGFLGIGEKRVAIGMDRLQFLQDANGNRYLYTNFTEEQLNAQAAYDEGTYAQGRDQQRLIVQ